MIVDELAYESVAADAKAALRKEFGEDALIYAEKAPGDRVFLVVVSEKLREKSTDEKQERIWDALRSALADRAQRIALATAWAPDELI